MISRKESWQYMTAREDNILMTPEGEWSKIPQTDNGQEMILNVNENNEHRTWKSVPTTAFRVGDEKGLTTSM